MQPHWKGAVKVSKRSDSPPQRPAFKHLSFHFGRPWFFFGSRSTSDETERMNRCRECLCCPERKHPRVDDKSCLLLLKKERGGGIQCGWYVFVENEGAPGFYLRTDENKWIQTLSEWVVDNCEYETYWTGSKGGVQSEQVSILYSLIHTCEWQKVKVVILMTWVK